MLKQNISGNPWESYLPTFAIPTCNCNDLVLHSLPSPIHVFPWNLQAGITPQERWEGDWGGGPGLPQTFIRSLQEITNDPHFIVDEITTTDICQGLLGEWRGYLVSGEQKVGLHWGRQG